MRAISPAPSADALRPIAPARARPFGQPKPCPQQGSAHGQAIGHGRTPAAHPEAGKLRRNRLQGEGSSSAPGGCLTLVVALARPNPRAGRAVAGAAGPPETLHPAELHVFDHLLGDRAEPVVVAGQALLRPEALRLAQRHLDGEQQVSPGDRAVMVVVHAVDPATGTYQEQHDSIRPVRVTSFNVRQIHATSVLGGTA